MTSQVVQGMGILIGRYGHLKSKIVGLKIHPSKTVEFLHLLSHWQRQLASHTELNFWLIPPAKQHQYPCSRPPKVYQGCQDLHVIVDLPIKLKEKLKQMFSSLLSQLWTENKDISTALQTLVTRVRLHVCLRRKLRQSWTACSLPFLLKSV